MRFILLLAAVIVCFYYLSSGPAKALVITEPGLHELERDVEGIAAVADSVTLDLNGHTVLYNVSNWGEYETSFGSAGATASARSYGSAGSTAVMESYGSAGRTAQSAMFRDRGPVRRAVVAPFKLVRRVQLRSLERRAARGNAMAAARIEAVASRR